MNLSKQQASALSEYVFAYKHRGEAVYLETGRYKGRHINSILSLEKKGLIRITRKSGGCVWALPLPFAA